VCQQNDEFSLSITTDEKIKPMMTSQKKNQELEEDEKKRKRRTKRRTKRRKAATTGGMRVRARTLRGFGWKLAAGPISYRSAFVFLPMMFIPSRT